MKNRNLTIWVIAIAAMLVLLGPLAGQSRGDFVLTGNQQLTVNRYHYQGTLLDWSRVSIIPGGWVYHLDAYDYSSVDVSSGRVDYLYTRNSSTADISGGYVHYLAPRNFSSVDISGGEVYGLDPAGFSSVNMSAGVVDYLVARESSIVVISGGSMRELCAFESSVVSFHGRNFSVRDGLILYADRVYGTGVLAGQWFDGTPWMVSISGNHPTATILAIPEPATLSLFALAGLGLLKKRRTKNFWVFRQNLA